MPDARTDQIAREAARLLASGEAADMDAALRRAAGSSRSVSARVPSRLQVRRHAQAMSMQAMGEAEYRAQQRAWLALAEELMATLEQVVPDSQTLLVGRAAEGHFDADPVIHIRIHTDMSPTALAKVLVELGCEEPAFTTMDSRAGRLSQLQWQEAEAGVGGVRIVLTRCPQRDLFESANDLVTGRPIAIAAIDQLRERLKATDD